MWVIPKGISLALEKKKSGKESRYMVSHSELGFDLPNGSDRKSRCDREREDTMQTTYPFLFRDEGTWFSSLILK